MLQISPPRSCSTGQLCSSSLALRPVAVNRLLLFAAAGSGRAAAAGPSCWCRCRFVWGPARVKVAAQPHPALVVIAVCRQAGRQALWINAEWITCRSAAGRQGNVHNNKLLQLQQAPGHAS